jgi:hypothetical protein
MQFFLALHVSGNRVMARERRQCEAKVGGKMHFDMGVALRVQQQQQHIDHLSRSRPAIFYQHCQIIISCLSFAFDTKGLFSSLLSIARSCLSLLALLKSIAPQNERKYA